MDSIFICPVCNNKSNINCIYCNNTGRVTIKKELIKKY